MGLKYQGHFKPTFSNTEHEILPSTGFGRARDPIEPSTDLYGHHAPALHPPKVLARNMRAHELREWQSQVQHIKNMAIDLQCDTPGHVYIKAFVDMAGFHVLLFHSLEHATRETKDRG